MRVFSLLKFEVKMKLGGENRWENVMFECYQNSGLSLSFLKKKQRSYCYLLYSKRWKGDALWKYKFTRCCNVKVNILDKLLLWC